MKKVTLLTSLIVFVTCVAVASEIYTWKDGNGVVHYSDVPNGQTSQTVTVTKPPPVVTGTPKVIPSQTSLPSTGVGASAPVPTAEEQQQAIAAQKQTEQFCEQAKKNLATLQETGRRVYMVSPNGEYHYFNDQERQDEIKKTQDAIKLNCTKT